jgi:hypothetical protein
MSRNLGSLTIDLIAKTGGFERGMDKAARTAEKRMNDMQRKAKIAGAAIGAGLVAGAALVTRAIGQTLAQFDEFAKMAQKVGITTEALSRLDYAARLSGVSMDSLGNGVKRLGQLQAEAARGGKTQAELFQKLGIEATNAAGGLRNADEVLRQVADVFARMPDGANKTALAVQLFGRAGADLIPLLNGGSRALDEFARKSDEVGYTLDSRTAKAAESFNDKIEELKIAVEGAWRQAMPQLITKLDEMADVLNSPAMREGLAAVASGIATIANNAIQATAAVGNFFSSYSRWLGNQGFLAASQGRSLDQLQARRDKLQKMLGPIDRSRMFDATGPTPARQLFMDLTGAREKIEAELKEIDGLIKAYPFRGVSGMATGGWEKVEVPALFTPTAKGGASGRSREADEARKLADALREMERAEAELLRQHEAMEAARFEALEGWTRIRAELEGPLAVAELDHIQRLHDIEMVGRAAGVTALEIAKAQDQATEAYRRSAEAMQEYMDAAANPELVNALDRLRWQTSDLFADLASGSMSALDAFKKFFDTLAEMITQMIAQRWAEQLFGAMGTTGKGTTGGGWFANLFGAMFGGGKAGGGSVQAGRLYEVNEQGTEMFSAFGRDYLLAGTNGNITPAHKVGREFSQTNVFHLAAPTNPKTQQQIAEATASRGQLAMRRNR